MVSYSIDELNRLTRPPGEHLTVFAGRAEADSIVGAHLNEVVRVGEHVLQPRVVHAVTH